MLTLHRSLVVGLSVGALLAAPAAAPALTLGRLPVDAGEIVLVPISENADERLTELRDTVLEIADAPVPGLDAVEDLVTALVNGAGIDLGAIDVLDLAQTLSCGIGAALPSAGIGPHVVPGAASGLSRATSELPLPDVASQTLAISVPAVGGECHFAGSSQLAATPVPEPSTALLCALGLAGLARARARAGRSRR